MDPYNIVYFLVSASFLIWSGSILVKHLDCIAKYLKLTEFVVGFIMMAFATSLPELLVGIQAAIGGVPELSLGDVLGSNILDLTLVIGIVIVLANKIVIKSETTRHNVRYMFLIALVPLLLLLDGMISRLDGVILLLIFFAYIWHLYEEQKEFTKKADGVKRKQFFWSVGITIIAISILLSSSYYTVFFAVKMGMDLGIPLFLVGILMLAFGTSLPELVFETKAVLSGHNEMALGDLYGSVVFNSTAVLGVTALIAPIAVSSMYAVLFSVIFLILSLMLFYIFVRNQVLDWQEGVVLIMVYIVFIIVQVELGTHPIPSFS